MFRYVLLLLVLLISTFHPALSQTEKLQASGRLLDPTEQGVSFSTVIAFLLPDTLKPAGGASTDDGGNFKIDGLKPGQYKLKVSALGFKTRWVGPFDLQKNSVWPVIKLESKANTLKDITVAEDKVYMQQQIDKKVFAVDRDLNSQGGTATDVLGNVPGVTVDPDRAVSLRGNTGVTILIDGKPSALLGSSRQAMLDQLPANEIESIEVITNPSAKYDPDGMAGIINIVMKKNRQAGMNGNLQLNVGSNDKYTGSLSLGIRKGKSSTLFSYSAQEQIHYLRYRLNRTNSLDTLFYLRQQSNGFNRNKTHSFRLSTEYNLSPSQTLSATGGFNTRDDMTYWDIDYRFLDSTTSPFSRSERVTGATRLGYNWDAAVSWKWTGKKPKQSFSADLNYSQNNSVDWLDARQDLVRVSDNFSLSPLQAQRTNTPRSSSIFTALIEGSQPIGKNNRIEAGLKLIRRSMDNDFRSESFRHSSVSWENDPGLTNRLQYVEDVWSAYGLVTGSLGKFGYSLGLRAEQTNAETRQITLGMNVPLRYFSLFPSLAIQRKLGEREEIAFNLSRRITRPSVENLNPFPEYTDPLNLMVGNPYLRPEFIQAAELSYLKGLKKGSFNINVYYRYQYDIISRFRTNTTDGVSTMTFLNLNNAHTAGAEFTMSWDPLKWFRNVVNANYFYQRLDGRNLEGAMTNSSYGGFIRYTGSFKIGPRTEAQLLYNTMIMGVLLQGTLQPMQSFDLAIRHDIMKGKASLSLRLNDVFDQREFQVDAQGVGFELMFNRKRESRILMAGFTWRFGRGKEVSAPKKRPDSGMDEGGGY